MVILTAMLCSSSATAEELPPVTVDTDSTTCSQNLAEQFVKELQLRTSAELLDASGADDNGASRLTLDTNGEETCEIRLDEDGDIWALYVDQDAGRTGIAAAATRLAWILDGVEMPESDSDKVLTPEETARRDDEVARLESDGGSAAQQVAATAGGLSTTSAAQHVIEIAEGLSTTATELPAASSPLFSTDVTAGAMWLPSAEAVMPIARLQTSWKPTQRLRFGLTGRLPLQPLTTTRGDTTHSYRPWAVELTAGYARKLGERWSMRADGGVRKTFSSITAIEQIRHDADEPGDTQSDDESQNPDEPSEGSGHLSENWREDDQYSDEMRDGDQRRVPPGQITSTSESSVISALMPWAAVVHGSVRYSLTRHLAVRADTGVAVSVADRQIRDEYGVLRDLGRFDVDLLVGIEARF